MLQTINLTKIYKPKKGVPVKALDDVSLTLPEKGMVFLLGKSGSGKSTLLNILGGLDRYNSGDILVMGKSTKKWGQSHFDSYRNTYVGFIFQEYNILEEFSVGANIALALQLQGRKPASEQVNSILKEVDLDGYGNRRPNELSGGQKQRVAIARALVKNPKIIMADEPTGALDSVTGRQVLNTLKKLSTNKLVLVVSHDREFAEQYADRIVELSDGRVIRDVQRTVQEAPEATTPVYEEESVEIPEQYELTAEDREAICNYIQRMVKAGKPPRFSLLRRQMTAFLPTDCSKIAVSQEGYKLIKSRLPLKYAFKLGASGLKHKKFRLVMTILLSCIALGMFGLMDTFAAYDYVQTAHSSLMDKEANVEYVAFEREYSDKDGIQLWEERYMTEEDLARIEDETGLDVYPVYEGYFDLYQHLPDYSGSSYYLTDFGGYIEVSEALLDDMDAELVAGRLPAGSGEIAVSTQALDTFKAYGYISHSETEGEVKTETAKIRSAEDLLGKTIVWEKGELTICGVVDTGLDMKRYKSLKDMELDPNADFAELVGIMAMEMELRYARNYSLSGLMMVAEGTAENYAPEYNGGIKQTLSPMPKGSREVRQLVEFSDRDFASGKATLVYNMMNPVTFELKNLDRLFEILQTVFFWIGLVFVVFSSLLFSNFIATSISYKKEQIGILRAIGSRGHDVFRIFFAESFIIAMINFALSFAGTVLVANAINAMVKDNIGLLLTVLTVGVRQALLLFGVCLLCAFVACSLPVYKIAAKRPIDAIRDR